MPSFTIAITIAFIGGKPGMISAATGDMALLFIDLVAIHGFQYLLAATILTAWWVLLMLWQYSSLPLNYNTFKMRIR